MFREMRRKRQQMSEERSVAVLKKMSHGVLALHGDDGYPYAVPLSYVYDNGRIYFHSALEGHKVEAVRRNPKVSFCVVEKDDINPARYTTFFRSVIAFGNARILDDETEKRAALVKLGRKYSPDDAAGLETEIAKGIGHLVIIELDITHLTGKEAIELVRQEHSE